jgi:hypothetical protein
MEGGSGAEQSPVSDMLVAIIESLPRSYFVALLFLAGKIISAHYWNFILFHKMSD